jgi:hypothetical protein
MTGPSALARTDPAPEAAPHRWQQRKAAAIRKLILGAATD